MPRATDTDMDFKDWYHIRDLRDEIGLGNPYSNSEIRQVVANLCEALMEVYERVDNEAYERDQG